MEGGGCISAPRGDDSSLPSGVSDNNQDSSSPVTLGTRTALAAAQASSANLDYKDQVRSKVAPSANSAISLVEIPLAHGVEIDDNSEDSSPVQQQQEDARDGNTSKRRSGLKKHVIWAATVVVVIVVVAVAVSVSVALSANTNSNIAPAEATKNPPSSPTLPPVLSPTEISTMCPDVPEGYDFVFATDSDGGDLENRYPETVSELAAACDSLESCVGFNTGGYLKQTIGSLRDVELSGSCYGLYVRKDFFSDFTIPVEGDAPFEVASVTLPPKRCPPGEYLSSIQVRREYEFGIGLTNFELTCSNGEVMRATDNDRGEVQDALTCQQGFDAAKALGQVNKQGYGTGRYQTVAIQTSCESDPAFVQSGGETYSDTKETQRISCNDNGKVVGIQVQEAADPVSDGGIVGMRFVCRD